MGTGDPNNRNKYFGDSGLVAADELAISPRKKKPNNSAKQSPKKVGLSFIVVVAIVLSSLFGDVKRLFLLHLALTLVYLL